MSFDEPESASVPAAGVRYAWVAKKVPQLNFGKNTHQDLLHQVSWEPCRNSSSITETKLEWAGSRSELWERFAQTTTGHGFARLVDKKEPNSSRMFWLAALVILILGLLISVMIISYESLIVRGLRREFIVQNNGSMFLPDIHICDTSLFNRTVLKGIGLRSKNNTTSLFSIHLMFLVELGFNDTMASYLSLSLSHLLASRSIIEDSEKRQLLDEEFNRLMKGKNIQSIFDNATLK